MSLQIKDQISPALKKLASQAKDKKPLLEAMGLMLVSLTKRAFTDEALRPAPWPNRSNTHIEEKFSKAGKKRNAQVNNETGNEENPLLRKSGALWHSIRIVSLTASAVTVGSDRVYAAIQQFGGIIVAKGKMLVFMIGGKKIFAKQVKIPPRPFFPFKKDGTMTPMASQKIEGVLKAKLKAMGFK